MTAPKRSDEQTTSAGGARPVRRRWRDYKTPAGRSPVEKFIDDLSDDDAALCSPECRTSATVD